jgi:hypothetical protein
MIKTEIVHTFYTDVFSLKESLFDNIKTLKEDFMFEFDLDFDTLIQHRIISLVPLAYSGYEDQMLLVIELFYKPE